MQAAAFLTPESSPAGPLLLLWNEDECCCLGTGVTCLHHVLGTGERGLQSLSPVSANLLMSLVSGSRFTLMYHHSRRWDRAQKKPQK